MDFSIFKDVSFPNNRIISTGLREEDRAVEKFFRNKKISEITRYTLENDYKYTYSACLDFMTPEAFAFFLPAFMKIAVQDYNGETSFPWIVVSCHLLPMAEGTMPDNRDAILSSYSDSQLHVVAEFLKEMSHYYQIYEPDDDATKAFDLFWGEFFNENKLKISY